MKKIYTVSILPMFLFFVFTGVSGQSWSVGLHFGENFSSLRGQQQSDYRLGFVAGVQASHYLTENLVMRLEVNMERKGGRFGEVAPLPFGDPDFANEYRLDYLSLPVLLRYSTGKKTKFIAGGGMSVDYLARERSEFGQFSTDDPNRFRRFDTNLIACVGGALPLGDKVSATLELRSLVGLVKIDKPTGVARELGRNISWGLMVGLNYYL